MSTTWTIAIDWGRTGSFDGTYDDVTSNVISAEWFLGAPQTYQLTADNSKLSLTLKNSDQRYSPEHAASPLAGLLGLFKMGGDPDVAFGAWDGGEFDLLYTFWIARYPVTVAQYAAFVEAGGYQERRYWTDAGWERKEQKDWT